MRFSLSMSFFLGGGGGGGLPRKGLNISTFGKRARCMKFKKMHEIMICVVPSAATKSLSQFLSRAVHTANIEIKQCVKCSHARG